MVVVVIAQHKVDRFGERLGNSVQLKHDVFAFGDIARDQDRLGRLIANVGNELVPTSDGDMIQMWIRDPDDSHTQLTCPQSCGDRQGDVRFGAQVVCSRE